MLGKIKPFLRQVRRTLKRIFRRENIVKAVVIISALALLATTFLPYLIYF